MFIILRKKILFDIGWPDNGFELNSFSEIKTLTTELNVERLNKIMINEKIEELRKVLPHDLRQATKKRHYSLGKGA